jgi:outer membrane usher protein FimD/PapC
MRQAFTHAGAGHFRRPVALLVALAIQGWGPMGQAAEVIQFNTDVLDISDRSHIDLSQFSQAGYIMPGQYQMVVRLNKAELPEQTLDFLPPDNDPQGSQVCLTHELVAQLGLKAAVAGDLKWWHAGQCLVPESLSGVTVRGDLGDSSLYLNVPQAYLEYTSDTWDPPARWDEGIAGTLFDYNLNGQSAHFNGASGRDVQSLSGNGTTGINLGAWRFRADWQGQYNRTQGLMNNTQRDWQWSRYYAWRAIPALKSKLMLGENYLNSGLFDSFRYTGTSLESDDNMLPPNLRGYAPEVAGVAKTNAKVTITQQGRVIHETTVAAGPFRIQDLNTAVSGTLEVKVQEQDGTEHTFQLETASIPYLTRPGRVRYKLALGKPSDYRHNSQGPGFATGEFSWGVNNGWSLYGGSLLAGDYNALAAGIGRDLLALGALSFDATESHARLPEYGTKTGGSYRLSYSKRFDDYDSQVTFAGYRFSQRNFMSMSEFLNARYHGTVGNNNKELYTIAFNKQFRSLGLSAYMNYSHQTYWNRPDNDTYNLSLSRYFDAWRFKNLSLNLSAYRTLYNNSSDDGLYLSLAVPWGQGGTLNLDSQAGSSGNTSTVGYFDRIDSNNSYRIKTGVGSRGNSVGSAYFTHQGNAAEVSANTSYEGSRYRSLGLSLQGGMTATGEGVALHRISSPGGTRMMVDTAGVAGVPVRGYGAVTETNHFGKAVVADISSYYRSSVSVDVNALADNVEATRSVVQSTLTEGAIGYRRFGVIAGEKAMVHLRLADGSTPPFGAVVLSESGHQAGIVNDEGQVWLTGMTAGETMRVVWSGQTQCTLGLPKPLPATLNNLLLPCRNGQA